MGRHEDEYINVKIAMMREKLTYERVAPIVGMSERALRNKVNGISDFRLSEATKLHRNVFPSYDWDTLFYRDSDKLATKQENRPA